MEPILDLLTEYDLPRSTFEPFYYSDPSYDPAHSWLAEADGRLVAHARVFPRHLHLHGVAVPIAGIGNVITARAARGRGYAGRVLRAMLATLPGEGYAYSLLWTHLPDLYRRFGWTTVPEPLVQAKLNPSSRQPPLKIRPFDLDDLSEVAQIYAARNQGRAGALVRTAGYWQAQRAWLQLQPREFLLVSDSPAGAVTAYARAKQHRISTELLEVGFLEDGWVAAQELLRELAAATEGRISGRLPPSMLAAIPADELTYTTSSTLMGRTLNLELLVELIQPVWRARATSLDSYSGESRLESAAGVLRLNLRGGRLSLEPGTADSAGSEHGFAHLLLRGFDDLAPNKLGGRSDLPLLEGLFPPQDFAIWGADAF